MAYYIERADMSPKDVVLHKIAKYRNTEPKLEAEFVLTDHGPSSTSAKMIYLDYLLAYEGIDKSNDFKEEDIPGFLDWFNNVLWSPAIVHSPPAERKTFIQALEDAFHNAGGENLLLDLAKSNPLEFLKICAKLNDSSKNNNAGLVIAFNIPKPQEKVVTQILED